MFKIPEDLEQELQKKYPKEHIGSIIQSLFHGIIEKTLKDGSCHIRELGKFTSFVTYSGRSFSKVVRFKFKTSMALTQKIKTDQYLIENLPVKAQVSFTEKHQSKCNTELKESNTKAAIEASQLGRMRTLEKINNQIVLDIANGLDDRDV